MPRIPAASRGTAAAFGGRLVRLGATRQFHRGLLALAGLALASTAGVHAAGIPTFADMPWGASRTQVLEAAAASGLRVVGGQGQDIELAGDLFGAAATAHALISPTAGLVKVQVKFEPGPSPARTYAAIVARLTSLYGPTEPVELFKRPFVRGDGREDEALRSGKGMLIAAWGDEREPGQAAVIVHAGRPGVELEYESHGWRAESVRRQRESTSTRGLPQLAE